MARTVESRGSSGQAGAGGGAAAAGRARPPGSVRAAAAVWAAAVALGAAEAAVAVGAAVADGAAWPELLPGLGLRTGVYAVVLLVVAAFYRGRRWARWALALGLGIVGTFSLVVDPLAWILQGGPASGFPEPTADFVAVMLLRCLHLLAVFAGLVLMFTPSAGAHFRAKD